RSDRIFVLPCDMPFVSPELIRHMLDHAPPHATTVARIGDHVQPLCGLYPRTALPVVEDCLRSGIRKMRDVLDRLNPTLLSITPDIAVYDPHLLLNINNPADFDMLRAVADEDFPPPS
ncbi:MAG: molybdenum cofactor guanylyltransferase, partial [Bacteroidota bacterium]